MSADDDFYIGIPTRADLVEVEAIIERGTLDANATRSALEYMAQRWLSDQLRKRERAEVRRIERATRIGPSDQTLALVERITASIAERRDTDWADLFDNTFALPDGERVTWRDATTEQHEARAAMLEVMAAGDLETAALHRQAIADIRAANASTLGAAL